MTGPHSTRRVFLIGFMGAGKTSVGKALARRLKWKFYDLDEFIENRERTSISNIFSSAGESAFRTIESAALMELLKTAELSNSIIALGGGTFVEEKNREMLQRPGAITVLLDAPLEELERRCIIGHGGRPLAQERERFRELFVKRREAYDHAQLRIQTAGKAIERVAREIEVLLSRRERAGTEVAK